MIFDVGKQGTHLGMYRCDESKAKNEEFTSRISTNPRELSLQRMWCVAENRREEGDGRELNLRHFREFVSLHGAYIFA